MKMNSCCKAFAAFVFVLLAGTARAQFTETFEGLSAGATSFTSNGQGFNVTNGFAAYVLAQAGWTGSAKDNVFIDNTTTNGIACGSIKYTTSIKTSNGASFSIKSIYAFTATCSGLNQNVSGTMTITGKLGGAQVFTYTKTSGFTINTSTNNGFTLLDFTDLGDGVNNSTKGIDEIEFTIGGSFGYLALDAFRWQGATVPTISTSGTLNAFSSCAGSVSTAQSFNVSGSNLTGNITATAPTGFEVSLSSGSGYGSSVTLNQSGGNVSSTAVYVRLTAAASGSPSGNVSMATSGGATKTVAASGTVNALPTINLGSVSNVLTNATSFSLPYNSTTGSPNQYSITTGSPTAMPSFSAVNNALLTGSPLSIAMPATGTGNTYNFIMTVKNTTTGCVSSNTAFTVGVTSPSISTTGSVSAFSTCAGTASTAQFINVSGTSLVANVTVSAPSGFEVSTSAGSGYGSSVTLTPSGNTLGSTPVYIRLTSSATGTPSGNIASASTNATTNNVAVSGTVNALPTIAVGTVAGVNTSATSFSIPYSGTTGTPNQYSITAGSPAMASFAAVSNATLGGSPISVTIPASAANTYGFNLTVRNSTTGCVSTNNAFSLTVSTPTINVTGSFSAFTTCSGTASTGQSVSVSGSNLGGNVTVTAPTGFEVSTTSGSGYGSSVSLSPSSGTLSSTNVYARIASGATGTPSGNVSFASTGASTQDKAVSGTVNTTPSVTTPSTASTCSGSSPNIALTANVNSTYTWTLGTNTGSITGASNSTGSPTAINQVLTNPTASAAGSIVYSVVPTSVTGSCLGSASNITVTVNPLTAITTHPSAAAVCASGNTSFTVAATGTNLSYQWQVDQGGGFSDLSVVTPYSNIAQATMNITGATVGLNGYTYRCVVSGSCPAATSNGAQLTVAHVWTGGTNTSWTTGSNWSCGTAPVASSNVIIPSGTSFSPLVTSNVTLNQLTINSGATLSNTGSNRLLTINGPLINNGIVSVGANNLVLNNSYSGTGTISSTAASTVTIGANTGTIRFTPASNNLFNLILNDNTSVTLGNALNMVGGNNSGSVSIGVNAVLTTGGFLTLKSDANGTGFIDIVQPGGSVSGNVTQERYVPAKSSRTYSLVASPFTQTIGNAWQQQVHITGAGTGGTNCPTLTKHSNGFDATVTNAPSMFVYDGTKAVGSRWTSITGTNAVSLAAGIGYRMNIRGPRSAGCSLLDGSVNTVAAATLSSTGTLSNANKNFGSFAITLANNGVTTVSNDNYLLTGNPYPSQVSFSALQATNNAAIQNNYAIYAPGNTVGNYAFWNGATFTGGNTGLDDATGDIIANGQAFFVQGKIAGSNISLNWSEDMKTTSLNKGYFRVPLDPNRLRIGYLLANGDKADEIMVQFDAKATNYQLGRGDVVSINSGSQYLQSIKAGTKLAFHARSLDFLNDTVQLHVASNANGNFSLSFYDFDGLVQANPIKIYLLDKYTGSQQLMNDSKEYPFTVDLSIPATQGSNRFAVVFSRPMGLLPMASSIRTYPNPVTDQLTIELPSLTIGSYSIKLLDITGKLVTEQKATGTTLLQMGRYARGSYLLEITNSKGEKQVQKIIKN